MKHNARSTVMYVGVIVQVRGLTPTCSTPPGSWEGGAEAPAQLWLPEERQGSEAGVSQTKRIKNRMCMSRTDLCALVLFAGNKVLCLVALVKTQDAGEVWPANPVDDLLQPRPAFVVGDQSRVRPAHAGMLSNWGFPPAGAMARYQIAGNIAAYDRDVHSLVMQTCTGKTARTHKPKLPFMCLDLLSPESYMKRTPSWKSLASPVARVSLSRVWQLFTTCSCRPRALRSRSASWCRSELVDSQTACRLPLAKLSRIMPAICRPLPTPAPSPMKNPAPGEAKVSSVLHEIELDV